MASAAADETADIGRSQLHQLHAVTLGSVESGDVPPPDSSHEQFQDTSNLQPDWGRDLAYLRQKLQMKLYLDRATAAAVQRALPAKYSAPLKNTVQSYLHRTGMRFSSAFVPERFGSFVSVTPQVQVSTRKVTIELFYDLPFNPSIHRMSGLGKWDVVSRRVSLNCSHREWKVLSEQIEHLSTEEAIDQMEEETCLEFTQRRELHQHFSRSVLKVYKDLKSKLATEKTPWLYPGTLEELFRAIQWKLTDEYDWIVENLENEFVTSTTLKIDLPSMSAEWEVVPEGDGSNICGYVSPRWSNGRWL